MHCGLASRVTSNSIKKKYWRVENEYPLRIPNIRKFIERRCDSIKMIIIPNKSKPNIATQYFHTFHNLTHSSLITSNQNSTRKLETTPKIKNSFEKKIKRGGA